MKNIKMAILFVFITYISLSSKIYESYEKYLCSDDYIHYKITREGKCYHGVAYLSKIHYFLEENGIDFKQADLSNIDSILTAIDGKEKIKFLGFKLCNKELEMRLIKEFHSSKWKFFNKYLVKKANAMWWFKDEVIGELLYYITDILIKNNYYVTRDCLGLYGASVTRFTARKEKKDILRELNDKR